METDKPFIHCYVGIDNGSTGTIGLLWMGRPLKTWTNADIRHVPTVDYLGYQKAGQMYKRVHVPSMIQIFDYVKNMADSCTIYLEKPYTSNLASKAVYHGAYAYEAMLIAMEQSDLLHTVISSTKWQKELLGTGLKGPELKKASLLKAQQTFPNVSFTGFRDADGLLIALYAAQHHTPF